MISSLPLALPPANLATFCEKWRVRELALFGSVLRPDFRPDSDVDILVTFAPNARPGWLDRVKLEEELAQLVGRRVDVVERRLVEDSPNFLRRNHILATARVIYGP